MATLILCPDTALWLEWLPRVSGGLCAFGYGWEAKNIVDTATRRHHLTALELSDDHEAHGPVYVFDRYSGEAWWKPSVEGFKQSMQLIARTDCGFTTFAGCRKIDPPIRYAKRCTLAEDAALAPDRLR